MKTANEGMFKDKLPLTPAQQADLLDKTADAITEENWIQGSYYGGVSAYDEKMLRTHKGSACAMGRMILLFVSEYGIPTYSKYVCTPVAAVEYRIMGTLVNDVIVHNDRCSTVKDIKEWLRRRAETIRRDNK